MRTRGTSATGSMAWRRGSKSCRRTNVGAEPRRSSEWGDGANIATVAHAVTGSWPSETHKSQIEKVVLWDWWPGEVRRLAPYP